MTVFERTRTVYRHLFRYNKYKERIDEYTDSAMRRNVKTDNAGVRGTYRSDPTARGGVMLAQLPKRIAAKVQWCGAIEDTLAECKMEDGNDDYGLAYILREYFCVGTEPRDEDKNAEAITNICNVADISRSTFFRRVSRITDIVLYHAARRKLI